MRLSSVPFLARVTPAGPPPGGGPATFGAVSAHTFGSLFGAGVTPARPTGIVSASLLANWVSSVTTATVAGMSMPSGWVLAGSVFSEFSGLGAALYLAPGTVADGPWSSSTGSNAAFDILRIDGANLSSALRDFQARTSATWPNFEDDDMPSPAATASAGDLVMSHYFQPQSTNAVGTPTSGYTRRVDSDSPTRISTLTRDNVPAGSTGEISHNTNSAYQGRVSITAVIAAAA